MFVKNIKFDEFNYTENLLNTVKYYKNGKVKAKMQLALCKVKNNTYMFNVDIDIFEGKANRNSYWERVGQQYANIGLDGVYLKDLNPSPNYIPDTYPNEKNSVDNEFMPWVLSAMEFMKELTPHEI